MRSADKLNPTEVGWKQRDMKRSMQLFLHQRMGLFLLCCGRTPIEIALFLHQEDRRRGDDAARTSVGVTAAMRGTIKADSVCVCDRLGLKQGSNTANTVGRGVPAPIL